MAITVSCLGEERPIHQEQRSCGLESSSFMKTKKGVHTHQESPKNRRKNKNHTTKPTKPVNKPNHIIFQCNYVTNQKKSTKIPPTNAAPWANLTNLTIQAVATNPSTASKVSKESACDCKVDKAKVRDTSPEPPRSQVGGMWFFLVVI